MSAHDPGSEGRQGASVAAAPHASANGETADRRQVAGTVREELMEEGKEPVPPGTRVMAVVRWGLVLLMALATAGSILYYFGHLPGAGQASAGARYYCPMHPQVIQDHPGDCPICGMSLVPGGDGEAEAKAAGREKSAAGHTHACPLHPGQTSADPAAECSICGSPMEVRPAGGGRASLAGAREGSPTGLVPVELDDRRIQLIGLRTARVKRAALRRELRAVGTVIADEKRQARIHTRFAGWIEELHVQQTGEQVRKGQVLAAIYSPELVTAQQELLTSRRWSQGGASSPLASSLESDARRRLELLGISTLEIEEVLRSGKPRRALSLRSPVSGHVTQKPVVQGAYVQSGAQLFEVIDLSRVWVLVEIYEQELGRVRTGQLVRFEVPAYPGQVFAGKVTFIYPTVDSTSRTLRLRLELANPRLQLRPGMFGNAILELAPAEGLIVPREALVDTGEEQYLFVHEGRGRFLPRRVKVGARAGAEVQILTGLDEGETVVTSGNFLVDSESRLQAALRGAGGGGEAAEGPGQGEPAAHGAGGGSGAADPHAGHGH